MITKVEKFLWVASFAAIGWILSALWTIDVRPPVVAFTGAEALNSPVEAGEDLIVRIYRIKVRDDCPVTSIRSLINDDGRRLDIMDAVTHAGGAAGESVEISYPIPIGTPPGNYFLTVHLIYDCGRGGVFHYDQPQVPLRVEAPR